MRTSAYRAVGQESPKLCSMEWKYSTRGGGGGLKGEWSQNPATQSGSIPQCHHDTATGIEDGKNATTCNMRTTERLISRWFEMMIYKINNQRENQRFSEFWYHDIKRWKKCSNSQVDKDMVGLLRAALRGVVCGHQATSCWISPVIMDIAASTFSVFQDPFLLLAELM